MSTFRIAALSPDYVRHGAKLSVMKAAALLAIALSTLGCTIKVETCPDNQDCAPKVTLNAEFCGNIVVGGQVVPVKCPADAAAGATDGGGQ